MPKIVISGISEEVVRTVAPRLIPAVAEALACPVEWISFEYVPSVYFAAEADKERCPMVEIYWFKRPVELMQKISSIFSEELSRVGINRVIIQIIDTLRENYFGFDLRCQIASFYIIFTGGLIHEQQ